MQAHEVKPKTKRKTKKTVGRGGKRGKTSGRGTKGQKARAGHRIRPAMRDIIKKLPKRRGEGVSRNRFSTPRNDTVIFNIEFLSKAFATGARITPKILMEKGFVEKRGDKVPTIKILGKDGLDKKLEIRGCIFSAPAKDAIEKAGGTMK